MREKLLWCAIYISAMQQERRDVMAIMCKRSGVCRSPAKVCHQVKSVRATCSLRYHAN